MQSKQYFTKIKNYPHEKSTEPKVLNYFFIYKTTGNDSTALVIKTFHIILLIKPNFDF